MSLKKLALLGLSYALYRRYQALQAQREAEAYALKVAAYAARMGSEMDKVASQMKNARYIHWKRMLEDHIEEHGEDSNPYLDGAI